jgi:hypothetical protein
MTKEQPAKDDLKDLIELLHKLSERSDASYVLTSVTALEDMLEMALLYKMRKLSKTSTRICSLAMGLSPLSRPQSTLPMPLRSSMTISSATFVP